MARNRTEVVEYLQSFHVPASAVLSMNEVLQDPQLQARAFWAYPEPLGDGVRMPGVPFVLPSSPDNFSSAPRLGADTAQALGEAGMAEDEIAALVEEAVVAKPGSDHD